MAGSAGCSNKEQIEVVFPENMGDLEELERERKVRNKCGFEEEFTERRVHTNR